MSVYPPTPTMSMMHGGADRKRAKRPPNVGSRELNSQENESLFALVGPDAVSLTAAVVQLLKSDRGSWKVEQPHGVISLVKDYAQRAYFLRIFDILDERVTWDFKLYKAFRVQSFPQCRKLLAFEQSENGNDGVVLGLNFFSEYESAEFKEHLDRRHAQERKSNTVPHPGMPMVMATGITATPTRPFEITQAYGGTIRGPPMTIGGSQGITPMGTMAAAPHSQTQSDGNATSSGSSWFKKDKNKKKDKKLKIKKEDISNPTNFQHKAHVGWNQDSGFSNTVYDDDMDEATRNILKAAGLESNNLNEDDKKFVKKFIAKNYDKYVSVGNLDPSQISAPMPPPIQQPIQQSWNNTPARSYKPSFPTSAPISSSSYNPSPVAPPPPTRVESHGLAPARPPPPPPTNRGYAPSRPLPQAPSYGTPVESRPHAVPPPPPPPPPAAAPAPLSSSAPPPPPPPPPMPSGGIAPMGAGAPPPPPPPPPSGGVPSAVLSSLPPAQNGRSNLLAEIQAGKQLRAVQQTSTESPKSGDARGDVMAQIRQGAQLKHVDAAAEQERRKSTTGGAAGMGGLAGALAKALEERRMNMGIDDSSDDDEEDDEKNEWSD